MQEGLSEISGTAAPAQNPQQSQSLEQRLEALEQRLGALEGTVASTEGDSICLVVYSGSLDRMLMALNIATGAAAMGCKVRIFFTFWGTTVLRSNNIADSGDRPFMDRMLGWMLPTGASEMKLSTMNMWGIGRSMIRKRMKEQGAADLDELFEMARESGVEILVCEMSMNLLGLKMEDLCESEGISCCGVGAFLGHALNSKITLLI